MDWWREARFGMFIHWGVYAVPAGDYNGRPVAGASEWLMLSAKVPVAEYRRYAEGFHAGNYDPDAWVVAAKNAGMRYIVVTTKHHDGFAMFPTKVNGWNPVDATPFGKDLTGPLVEACRRHGMPIGFYYSHAQDWSNKGAIFGGTWDPEQEGDFDEYIDKTAIPQIREILTLYGPGVPAVLWWDTPAMMTPERAARIDAAVQELAPGILQNDRLGGGFAGDFETPEQRIPAERIHGDWETCMTTNESWGFNQYDQDWKSPTVMIRQLCEVVGKGGNYLLNVGPRSDGTIPAPTLDALAEIGDWMRVNGEAIHGASAGPFPHRLPWGIASQRGNTVYLFVDSWPDDGRLFVPLFGIPECVQFLADPGIEIPVQPGDGAFHLCVPPEAPDDRVTVVRVRFPSSPRLGAMPPRPRPGIVPQPADGSFILKPGECEPIGPHIAVSAGGDPYIGCWTSLDSYPQWRIRIDRPGRYVVAIDYAIPCHRQGSRAEVEIGGKRLPLVAGNTGGWAEYVRLQVGQLDLEAGTEVPVKVVPIELPLGALMNLRAVYITPTT